LRITTELRTNGISADRAFENRSMKSQMKAADRSGAPVAIIIGSNELEAGTVVVRPLRGEDRQRDVPRDSMISEVTEALIGAPREATA
jgi:histidyl-tRNA synthetase